MLLILSHSFINKAHTSDSEEKPFDKKMENFRPLVSISRNLLSPPNLWGPETFLNLSTAQKEVNGAPQNEIPKRPGPEAPAGTTVRGQLQAGGRSSSEGQSD